MVKISEAQWLEYFGFSQFPFDRLSAGLEGFTSTDFLSCFVEPDSFERVLGQADSPVTALVFAERGIGKTACRIAAEYYCQQGLVPNRTANATSYVLSVPHLSFESIVEIQPLDAASPSLVVERHTVEILKCAISTMVDFIAGNSVIRDGLKNLSVSDQSDLSCLVSMYDHYLGAAQTYLLKNLGLYSESLPNSPSAISGLRQWEKASPLNHIVRLSNILGKMNIPAIYVFTDGIDELPETSGDPVRGYEILKPLLHSMKLMDGIPHLALKFFLPYSLKPLLDQDRVFRRDRGFNIETISWRESQLIEILRRRLAAFSYSNERTYTEAGFDALCVPELGGQIEHTLAKWAEGNPRYLLLLCGMMVKAHCKSDVEKQDDPYQLNKDDLNIATKEFQSEILGIRKIASRAELRVGTEISNRYKIQESIGTTLHSKIVRAWDQTLQRIVAIKFIYLLGDPTHEDKEISCNSLEREARILASLKHPNIGLVYDIIYEPLGIVMEWIEGMSLQDLLRKSGPLHPPQVVSIAVDICQALRYAHQHGVTHRDVKPANIILTGDSKQRAMLIDFDVASAVQQETISMSEDGMRNYVGTPPYSAPEQLRERVAGPMSDMFALGVLLYELLTGQKPYMHGNDPSLYEGNTFPLIQQQTIPDVLFESIVALLQEDQAQRLDASRLLVRLNIAHRSIS